MDAAYCGPPPHPDQIAASFNLDPVLLCALGLLALALRRSPVGLAAVAVLAVAFVSPLCALSSALFAARSAHHLLLTAAAAPLLALALPRAPSGPAWAALAVSTGVLWAWHLPAAYDAALSHVAVYWGMQLSLLASAIWFWRTALDPARDPVRGVGLIVAGFAQMGLLGALLTFAARPLYAAHASAPYAWGMTPLQDQALGGLLMWVVPAVPYGAAAALTARRGWSRLKGAAA